MSIYDYDYSREIALRDYPFYGLIMASMRQADTENLNKLKLAFPDTWLELSNRIAAPAGMLQSDAR